MKQRRFHRVPRGYVRSQQKSTLRTVLEEEFYDPELETPHVGGGDPGIVLLMSSLHDAALDEASAGTTRAPVPPADPAAPADVPPRRKTALGRVWARLRGRGA